MIPRELEAELYDRLSEYYRENADVTVIVERRAGPDRRQGPQPPGTERRAIRDRRRARVPGTFPRVEAFA